MSSDIYHPNVSVIIATFNREKFLHEAIKSVLDQTYENFELIIIDDGSTDNTRMMVKNFTDPRIKYVYQNNKGRSNARNRAIGIAKGSYIAFLDSDDLYLPDKLSLQVEYFDNHPDVGMMYTSALCIDEKGKILPFKYEATVSGSIYKEIAFFVPVTITLPTVMVRREIFLTAGVFDEKMHRFEDTDMWRRISKVTKIYGMKEYTCKLRTHSHNHLLAQNPEELVAAVHYYAEKIKKEDAKEYSSICNNGLLGFYKYYGAALLSVPEWQRYGKDLLKKAEFYEAADKINDFYFKKIYSIKYGIINFVYKMRFMMRIIFKKTFHSIFSLKSK